MDYLLQAETLLVQGGPGSGRAGTGWAPDSRGAQRMELYRPGWACLIHGQLKRPAHPGTGISRNDMSRARACLFGVAAQRRCASRRSKGVGGYRHLEALSDAADPAPELEGF